MSDNNDKPVDLPLGASLGELGDVRDWCFHQLEAALKKLTEKVSLISYTRNPEVLAEASRQCDHLEAVLTACEFQLQLHSQSKDGQSESDYQNVMSELLFLEATRMLGDARALVRVPLEPVYIDDNVVELRPNYGEITDEAFERMLASSDIPQFLSTPDSWPEESSKPAVTTKSPAKSKLTLVYSANKP